MNVMHVMNARGALPATTAMRLAQQDLIALDVQAGDRLRSDCGTVWITVDGEERDVLLESGDVLTVQAAGRLNVSALRNACLVVLGRAPLRWRRVGDAGRGFGQRTLAALAALVAPLNAPGPAALGR